MYRLDQLAGTILAASSFSRWVQDAVRPFRVLLSVITSWGISRYVHGLPPFLPACAVACWHHSTAALALARTSRSSISSARLVSQTNFAVLVSTTKSGS